MAAVAQLDGDALARLRAHAGLTMKALAAQVGASSEHRIWHWETGAEQPRPHFIPELARVLGVAPLHLLTGDPERPNLSALRLAAGLAPADVVTRAALSRMTYSRLERGVGRRPPDASVVKAVAAVLGRPEDEIVDAIVRARQTT